MFVGRATLEISVASAVLSFNDGSSGVLNVLNSLKTETGKFATEFCGKRDNERVKKMDLKSSDQTKLPRKQLRAQRKGFIETVERKRAWYMVQGNFECSFPIFNI